MTAHRARPNILLLIMDATRARHLSCYGYGRETSPNVDQMAARGVLYEECISPGTWTLSAVASILTGLYVSQHQTTFEHQYLEPRFVSIAELLRETGYDTALFTAMGWTSETFGFHRGFDTFVNYSHEEPWAPGPLKRATLVRKAAKYARYYLTAGSRGKETYEITRGLRRWFNTSHRNDRPFFVMAHFADPHWPWVHHPRFSWVDKQRKPPKVFAPDGTRFMTGEVTFTEEEQEMMVDYYDGEIRFLDSYLGQTFEWLHANGQLDNTLVVVTADHGEELAEHGLMGHAFSMYDNVLHVPLILYHPDHFAGGQRVSEPVQTIDVFSTIVEMLGIEHAGAPNSPLGRSLQPESVLASPRSFTISECLAPSLLRFKRVSPHFDTKRFERQLRALRVRESRNKLIWSSDGCHELYNLATDPLETTNLADRQPEEVKTLLLELESWLATVDTTQLDPLEAKMEPALVDRLRALGYL